jgi:hypothetical protein
MVIPVSHVKVNNNIFISIASYRDPLLKFTITEAYKNAKNKENLIFGVVEQNDLENSLNLDDFTFKEQIRYVRVNAEQSRGCCWARNLVQSLYQDENYYFQIDSHTAFDKKWDETLIFALEELKRYHSKPIISQYPDALEFEDDKPIKKRHNPEIDKIPFLSPPPENEPTWAGENTCHIIARGTFQHSFQPYTHGYMISAGCLFTYGNFVNEVPYDPRLFFQGEETTLALRAWTRGWNIFHAKTTPIYHFYTDHEKRTRKLFWDEDQNEDRNFQWGTIDSNSVIRTNSVLTGCDVGPYGIGEKRTLDQFQSFTGIDYRNKIYTPRESLHRHDYKKSPEDYIRKQ